MVDPRSCRVSTAYDLAGRRIALTDPNGKRTTFAYDVAGQEVLDTDPLGRRTTFAYDPAGRRTLCVDPRGVAVTTLYDAAGQRVGDLFPGGPRPPTPTTRPPGRVLAADAAGRVTTAYDPKGRVVLHRQPRRQTHQLRSTTPPTGGST